MYPIIRLSKRLKPLSIEEIGTKPKFWFRATKATSSVFASHNKLLFKSDSRGTGEDWAEKISCELCSLLGLPHVQYELAYDDKTKRPGVICPTCAPGAITLFLGNELLVIFDPSYPITDRKYRVKSHTVTAVAEVIAAVLPPEMVWMGNAPDGLTTSLDVFVGYIMLDAWIANQDRHHENWGVLLHGNRFFLAPTFDHGAALARNITDEERRERLMTKDRGRCIAAYARKARSALYSDASQERTLTTYDAWRLFSSFADNGSYLWQERLAAIDENDIWRILERIPPERLSEIGREFTFNLLRENRSRILDGDDR
jgi:hypothetical protein